MLPVSNILFFFENNSGGAALVYAFTKKKRNSTTGVSVDDLLKQEIVAVGKRPVLVFLLFRSSQTRDYLDYSPGTLSLSTGVPDQRSP